MKKNNLLIMLSFIFIFVVISLIIYGIKITSSKYIYESKFMFVCKQNKECDYNIVNYIYPPLKKYVFRTSNINYIVDEVNEKLEERISSEDVKSTITINKSGQLIILTVKYKNPTITYFIEEIISYKIFSSFGNERDVKLYKIDKKFADGPNLTKHLTYAVATGIIVGSFIISSGFEIKFKKTKFNKLNK